MVRGLSSFLIPSKMKKYTVKLDILENGDGVLKFPNEVVDKFQLKVGDKIELIPQKDGSIRMKPLKSKPKLDNLQEGINEENLDDEIDFG